MIILNYRLELKCKLRNLKNNYYYVQDLKIGINVTIYKLDILIFHRLFSIQHPLIIQER